jgi:hypothetical protein
VTVGTASPLRDSHVRQVQRRATLVYMGYNKAAGVINLFISSTRIFFTEPLALQFLCSRAMTCFNSESAGSPLGGGTSGATGVRSKPQGYLCVSGCQESGFISFAICMRLAPFPCSHQLVSALIHSPGPLCPSPQTIPVSIQGSVASEPEAQVLSRNCHSGEVA